jgi:hypothetical protein
MQTQESPRNGTTSNLTKRLRGRAWEWVARHPYTSVAVAYLFSQAFPAILRHNTEWHDVYVAAAHNLLAGRDFLQAAGGYVYPPFFAALTIPFTLLPQSLSQLSWYLISSACLVHSIKGAWRLSGGGPLQGVEGSGQAREHLIFVLGLFCAVRFLFNALSHLQTDLLIAALVIAGCLAVKSNRTGLAATQIGLAAAIKCTPLLFAPYLVWRGKWLAAVWLVVAAVGLNLLPDLVRPSPSGELWLKEWYTRYLLPLEHKDYVPGVWHTDILNNQSLAGAVNRFFTTRVKSTAKGVEIVSKESALTPQGLKTLTGLLYAAIAAPCLYALWRRRRAGNPRRHPPDADALEFSMVLLLMLLLSPNSSRAHFGVMLLPAFCVARIAVAEKNRFARMVTVLATLATLICYNIPGLNSLHAVTLWAGAVTLAAVLLLAGCVMGLLRQGEPDMASPVS